MTYLCRLCLKTSKLRISLSTGNLLEKIESLTSIKIEEDARLPKTCCKSCVSNIYKYYNFRQDIIKSDRILKEKLSRNEFQIIEQAKQAPDLFEVLHLEGPPNNTESDVKNALLIKLEKAEKEVNVDNIDHLYKKEEEIEAQTVSPAGSIRNSNLIDGVTTGSNNSDSSIFEDIYFDIKDDLSNMIFESNNVKYIEVENFKKELPSDENLLLYYDKRKSNSTTLECADCDAKFESKRKLEQHRLKHKTQKCPICSITMRIDNIKRHMQIHTDSPEVCDICGKIAKNKESLRGHMNYQHKNTDLVKCETCNKEFKSNRCYKMHVKKIHLGIRNHQCHICGKKFFENHSLIKHITISHQGARPYICQYCKKGFSSPYARKTHLRQHTLETPYRCEICAAGFRQKISLVNHLKSKHLVTKKTGDSCDGIM